MASTARSKELDRRLTALDERILQTAANASQRGISEFVFGERDGAGARRFPIGRPSDLTLNAGIRF